MTSAHVSKMTSNMPFQTNASAKTGKNEQETADFMGMLGGLAMNYQMSQNHLKDSQLTKGDWMQPKTEYGKFPVKETKIPEAAAEADGMQMEKAQEKFEEFADDMKEKVTEVLDVSEEQVETAMEELGLTYADLLNPAKLAELVTDLTGKEESLEVLMNEDFQELMQGVEVLGEELLQELGMPAEEAAVFLDQIQQNISQETVEVPIQDQMEETVQAEQTVQIDQPEEITSEGNLSLVSEETEKTPEQTTQKADQTAEIPVEEDIQREAVIRTEEDSETSQEDSREEPQSAEASKDPETTEDTEDTGKVLTDKKESFHQIRQGSVEGHTVNTIQTGAVERIISDVSAKVQNPAIDVADIIRQVSEFTRVMYQGSVTSMEMQLNPENLGKIYVQITAKEGMITARIAAQNEAVKEVLESQTAMLKENMSQQGLKVEAVEVTVASHEFERNLEENQHNQSREEQKEQNEKNNRGLRRGISLDQLDELSGLMSEEELLAAKIMRDNGNSVDFSA